MSPYRMPEYFGRMISTACPRISSSRLSPNTTSPSPPALAAGAHSGATITMYTIHPLRWKTSTSPGDGPVSNRLRHLYSAHSISSPAHGCIPPGYRDPRPNFATRTDTALKLRPRAEAWDVAASTARRAGLGLGPAKRGADFKASRAGPPGASRPRPRYSFVVALLAGFAAGAAAFLAVCTGAGFFTASFFAGAFAFFAAGGTASASAVRSTTESSPPKSLRT